MPSVYALKPAFQGMLRPIAGRLAAWGISANAVTIGTAAASIALGIALASGRQVWILLPPFLFVRMALNAIDGMLAREHGQQSRLGAVLNEAGDLLSDAALTLPLAVVPGWNAPAVMIAAAFSALTEFAGLAGGGSRYEGPFGKSDRALALGALGFWLGVGLPVAAWAAAWFPRAWVALCCLTIWNRVGRVGT